MLEEGGGDLGELVVRFEADSTYDTEVSRPMIRILFRDEAGDLIGGVTDFSDGYMEPEGHFKETIEVNQTLTGIDPDKTEVYLDPSD